MLAYHVHNKVSTYLQEFFISHLKSHIARAYAKPLNENVALDSSVWVEWCVRIHERIKKFAIGTGEKRYLKEKMPFCVSAT